MTEGPAGEEPSATDPEVLRRLERAERRVARLETFVDGLVTTTARTVAALGSVALVLGLVVPFAYVEIEDRLLVVRVLSAPFQVMQTEGTDGDGFAYLMAIGFAGLSAVLVGCLVLFLRVWLRDGTSRVVRVGSVFAWLAAVGTMVTLIFWAGYQASDNDETGGPGVVPLVVGVELVFVTLLPAFRQLWIREDSER